MVSYFAFVMFFFFFASSSFQFFQLLVSDCLVIHSRCLRKRILFTRLYFCVVFERNTIEEFVREKRIRMNEKLVLMLSSALNWVRKTNSRTKNDEKIVMTK